MRCSDELVGIDSETELIQNKFTSPPVVIAGFCSGNEVCLVRWQDLPIFLPLFLKENPTTKLVFFNGAFDINVMGRDVLLEELKKDNRIMELGANYRIARIAQYGWFKGKITLDSITKEVLGTSLDKTSGTRTSYTRDLDFDDPANIDYCTYLVEDCISTYQCGKYYNGVPTETLQARADFVLSEISRNGLKVDQEYVKRKQEELKAEMEELKITLKNFGFRVKEDTDGLSQAERLRRILRLFDMPGEQIALVVPDGMKIGPKLWVMLTALVCYIMQNGIMGISKVHEAVFIWKNIHESKPKFTTKAEKTMYDTYFKLLRGILESIDCLECIDGLGNARPTGATAYIVLLECLAEAWANGECINNLDKPLAEFRELHEENMGWLPTAEKKLSPTAFLQQHVRNLLAQHPGLELPYTDSAQEKINERIDEEKKLAKKEGRPMNPVDISDLQKYQVKACDMWRLTDKDIIDPFLTAYTTYKHKEKMLNTYFTLKYVDADGRVHTRFNTAKTMRTTSSSPNIRLWML